MIRERGRRGRGIRIVLARKSEMSGLSGGKKVGRWLELRIQVVLLLTRVVELRVELCLLVLLL